MICNVVDDKLENEGINRTITIVIDNMDNYKFRRWVDLMNAYDDMRKSTHEVNKLSNEIMEDYDKDEDIDGTI